MREHAVCVWTHHWRLFLECAFMRAAGAVECKHVKHFLLLPVLRRLGGGAHTTEVCPGQPVRWRDVWSRAW
jgi:hypothetical protein